MTQTFPDIPREASPAYGVWSTREHAGSAKVDFWNNLTSSVFTPLAIDPDDREAFEAKLARADVGNIGIARIWSEGSSVQHSRRHVALSKDKPCFLLHLQVAGSSLNEQAGRATHLRPGDCALVDSSRPYSLKFGPNTRFIVCRMDAAALRNFLQMPEDMVSILIPGDQPATRILRQLLHAYLREADRTDTYDWAECSDSVLLSSLAVATRAILAPRQHYEHHLLDRAMEIVNKFYCDDEFGVGSIATELGVSERYVQLAFSAHGTTPSDFIRKKRVERAAHLLKSSDMKVTEIAMESGFSDVTHFGRSFRRVMGINAMRYRRDRH